VFIFEGVRDAFDPRKTFTAVSEDGKREEEEAGAMLQEERKT
jgi:hypothetical protein